MFFIVVILGSISIDVIIDVYYLRGSLGNLEEGSSFTVSQSGFSTLADWVEGNEAEFFILAQLILIGNTYVGGKNDNNWGG